MKKRKDSFKEYENYSSDEYKENVLKKFSKKNFVYEQSITISPYLSLEP